MTDLPDVPTRGRILFSDSQYWSHRLHSALNVLGKDTLRLTELEDATAFEFTCVRKQRDEYTIRSLVNGKYLCWDTDRFEFRDEPGPWEVFGIIPMNEHGHLYYIVRCHKGYLDSDGKGGFRAEGNGVRCYISPM